MARTSAHLLRLDRHHAQTPLSCEVIQGPSVWPCGHSIVLEIDPRTSVREVTVSYEEARKALVHRDGPREARVNSRRMGPRSAALALFVDAQRCSWKL